MVLGLEMLVLDQRTTPLYVAVCPFLSLFVSVCCFFRAPLGHTTTTGTVAAAQRRRRICHNSVVS